MILIVIIYFLCVAGMIFYDYIYNKP